MEYTTFLKPNSKSTKPNHNPWALMQPLNNEMLNRNTNVTQWLNWHVHINCGLLKPSHTRTNGSFMTLVINNDLMQNKFEAFDCDYNFWYPDP